MQLYNFVYCCVYAYFGLYTELFIGFIIFLVNIYKIHTRAPKTSYPEQRNIYFVFEIKIKRSQCVIHCACCISSSLCRIFTILFLAPEHHDFRQLSACETTSHSKKYLIDTNTHNASSRKSSILRCIIYMWKCSIINENKTNKHFSGLDNIFFLF